MSGLFQKFGTPMESCYSYPLIIKRGNGKSTTTEDLSGKMICHRCWLVVWIIVYLSIYWE